MALGKRLDHDPRLPGIVPSKMLSAPAFEVRIIKAMEWAITMILSIVIKRLGRLEGLPGGG